jgi:hypothetical protein
LEEVKATVEGLLESLKPAQLDPLKDHPELPIGKTLVETFAGSSAAA